MTCGGATQMTSDWITHWQIWLLIGLLLALSELMGGQFVLLALGVAAALTGAASAALDLTFNMQLVVFAVTSAVTVPLGIRWYRAASGSKRPGLIGEGGEIGMRARVTVENGRIGVKLQGHFFPARLADGAMPVEDSEVEVTGMSGITVTVQEIASQQAEQQ